MEAFDLAIQQLSTPQLRRLIAIFKKNASHCVNREDYVNLLKSSLSKQQRIIALKEFALAGRTAMSLFRWEAVNKQPRFRRNFTGTATDTPTIVTVGGEDEINDGQQHVQWTTTAGNSVFLNLELDLHVEPEAIVVDSFYDRHSAVLQIRGNTAVARKIARQWALMSNLVYGTQIRPYGISTVDNAHAFCDLLAGHVREGTGDKLHGKGFQRVSGRKAPGIVDLRGTPDYEEFKAEVAMFETQIEFDYGQQSGIVLGMGLETLSIVFVTNVDEAIIMHVYSKLKKFLKL
jgi:hypothetical protein